MQAGRVRPGTRCSSGRTANRARPSHAARPGSPRRAASSTSAQRRSETVTVPRPVIWSASRRSGRKTAPASVLAPSSTKQVESDVPAQAPVRADPNPGSASATSSMCVPASHSSCRSRRTPARWRRSSRTRSPPRSGSGAPGCPHAKASASPGCRTTSAVRVAVVVVDVQDRAVERATAVEGRENVDGAVAGGARRRRGRGGGSGPGERRARAAAHGRRRRRPRRRRRSSGRSPGGGTRSRTRTAPGFEAACAGPAHPAFSDDAVVEDEVLLVGSREHVRRPRRPHRGMTRTPTA